jgi:hypothetical protein
VSDEQIAFLRARLDEDEAAAREATADPGMAAEWHETTSGCLDVGLPDHGGEDWRDYVWPQGDSRVTRFIARHDPASVLRDVEADRAILALLEQDVTDGRERDYDATGVLEQVVRIRAARFRDHPDYRPEWKP